MNIAIAVFPNLSQIWLLKHWETAPIPKQKTDINIQIKKTNKTDPTPKTLLSPNIGILNKLIHMREIASNSSRVATNLFPLITFWIRISISFQYNANKTPAP